MCVCVCVSECVCVSVQGLFQNFAPGGANASGPNIRGGKYKYIYIF